MTYHSLPFTREGSLIAQSRDACERPSPSLRGRGLGQSSPTQQRRQAAARSTKTITETQPCVIILQLTDELLAQLQPFLGGLDIATTAQCLTMRVEVYKALAERIGSALDYDVRWLPNEYEPDGFVERVRPLELTNGILAPVDCSQCQAQLLANRNNVTCACGQAVSLP